VFCAFVFKSKQVDLCSAENLWGLSNRCVGFESVALIADVLKMVKPSLVSLTTAKDGPSKEVCCACSGLQFTHLFFVADFRFLFSIRGRQACAFGFAFFLFSINFQHASLF
jgi:hypothetical protein